MALRYTSKDPLQSGLPLGGIGAGSMQIFADGTRGVFTGLNNWEKPLGQLHWFRAGNAGDYRASNPFAVFMTDGKRKVARLLQTVSLDSCPTVDSISFEASFPVATLHFKDREFLCPLTLKAFSPFLHHDSKGSAIPGVVYTFHAQNTTKKKLTLSLLSSGVNVNGRWNVGRYNTVVKKRGLVAITFHKNHPHPRDEKVGLLSLSTDEADGEVSYWGQWPYIRTPFKGNGEDRRFDAWASFSDSGTLPDSDVHQEAMGECDEWMGALAVRFSLKPGQEKEISFYYTWHMPNHYLGHIYEKWFNDSIDVAVYLKKNKKTDLRKVERWQKVLNRSLLPEWLKEGMIQSLSVISAASWWTKDNQFSMYENPVKWPLMDSLDVRYYGTTPLLLFFPDLERNTMLLFKKYQRKDGRIPHDLGWAQLDCPSDGTTAGHPWKDLSTKYALMAYRDSLWVGNRDFLKVLYPSVKRAMQWEFKADKDNDGLPENEGRDSTYDLWDFYGVSSYTANITLASLVATAKMALSMEDFAFARECQEKFEKGKESFDEKLWNGSYYMAARTGSKIYDACVLGQLNGQWYAHHLGLGYLSRRENIKKAVSTILRLNGRVSRYGAVNSVFKNGRIDRSNHHSENIWVGETYAFSALAVEEGFVREGLALAEKTWKNFTENVFNVWYQPDVVYAKDGKAADGELYVRNLALWTIAFALARKNRSIAGALKALEPALKF